MSELNSGRPKPWNIYGSSYPSPSQTEVGREGPWNSFGTSMNAISFGFVATAILISMFLIMAIFEHLFRPNASFLSSQDNSTAHLESPQVQKLGDSHSQVQASYASDFSVVMPGQQYPTFIAQPAPLPCPREGAVYWPSHQHT
ncbi:uncharacterized protein LOC111394795 isoform X1 [Olea europaea subsp. europaea]|uniref:Uncharacterized protein LOC111394795 isoform X1 n=1 Tax=Olea europaea subsp. europaea TaxID=158383 RepID=A0A8S0PJA3_OLEEU|nr:uncharacterized protein LOC111394795 isoform X1 [Olea europaea subsp. europaea]